MLLINLTGLERWYLLPAFAGDGVPGTRLWWFSIRWIGVELIFQSKAMGAEAIRRFNRTAKEVCDGV